MSKIQSLEPVSPFVEGYIRFIWEEQQAKSKSQGEGFELLAHTHVAAPSEGEVPQLHTHPLAETKLLARDGENGEGRRHLDEIPIHFLGRNVDDVLRAEYRSTTSIGTVICRGDGCKANRGREETPCVGPAACQLAQTAGCRLHVRMHVAVDGSDDPYAVFEFQSTSPNTYRALKSKLMIFEALAGNNLQGLPLRLTTWKKSTKGSSYQTFYCANIDLREGQSIQAALELAQEKKAALLLEKMPSFSFAGAFGEAGDDVVGVGFKEMNTSVAVVAQTAPQAFGDPVEVVVRALEVYKGSKQAADVHQVTLPKVVTTADVQISHPPAQIPNDSECLTGI